MPSLRGGRRRQSLSMLPVTLRLTPKRARSLLITVAGVIAVVVAVGIARGFDNTTRSRLSSLKTASGEGPEGHRWYAPTSLWNTPIGPHPRLAQNNSSLVAALSKTSSIGVAYDYTPAIWYASASTPKVPVRIDFPHCNASTVWVPIPRGAIPDSSSEGQLLIAQFGTGIEFDFYRAQSPGRPPKSSVYYPRPCRTVNEWTAAKVVTTNWQSGSGELHSGVRGSGTPEGAGTILPRDTQQPPGATWDHALAMAYQNTCSIAMSWCPRVAPATAGDGTCTDRSKCLPEGARLQLDPSIDCSTWPLLSYEWQRQLCRTLQVYGGIVVETNRSGPTIGDQWHGSLRGYTWPWLRDRELNLPRAVLSYFRVLAWRSR
jgi:hypothetical protein